MQSQVMKRSFILGLLLLLVSSCQPQVAPLPVTGASSAEQTLAALVLTLTAQVTGATEFSQLATTEPASLRTIATATHTPSLPPPDTLTPSPSIPMVSVNADTNCRTGPSKYYKFVVLVQPGPRFVMVGRHTPSGYWIIQLDSGGQCWLWGEHALVEGNTGGLPEYTQPAVGRIEGEVRKSAAADAGPVSQASVDIGHGFATYNTGEDGSFVFEDVPMGEIKIIVLHSYYRFPTAVRVYVQAGEPTTVRVNAIPVPRTRQTPPPTRRSPCTILQSCMPLPTQGPLLP